MNKKIDSLVEELREEMISFFRKSGRDSGFAEPHHQRLYDTLNVFQAGERNKKAKKAEKAVV